jgi:hypothetical protein
MCGTRRFGSTVLRALLTVAAVPLGTIASPSAADAVERATGKIGAGTQVHLLDGGVADVVVRVRGSSVCSGTPIARTRYVITAAHCVLGREGEVVSPIVERGDGQYRALEVLVDRGYTAAPSPQRDAAVLVMDRAIPGRSAILGDTLPGQDVVTLAGFQPLDTDGTLLRPTNAEGHAAPKGVTGGVVRIETALAGCVRHVSAVEVTSSQLTVPCGLVPGASGGGRLAEDDRGAVLVGVVSTVSFDLSSNGVTPVLAVHRLIEHPGRYAHDVSTTRPMSTGAPIGRS